MATQVSQDFEAALERAAQPWNDYAKGKTALAIANAAREQQLSDVANARQYESAREERASHRRSKEYQDQERLRLAQEYAKLGVDTTDGKGNVLPLTDLNRNYRDFQKNRAENILTHFDSQLDDNKQSQKEAINRIQTAGSKAASPEQNRKALTLALADPVATKWLSDEQKAMLEKQLLGNSNPEAAVRSVFKSLNEDYGFLSHGLYTRESVAKGGASSFYSKYLEGVNVGLDENKKIDQYVYTKELDDLNKGYRDLALQRDRHIMDFAPFLPKEAITKSHAEVPVTPPTDPNEAFKDIAPPAPQPVSTPSIASINDVGPVDFPIPSSSEELGATNFTRGQLAAKAIQQAFPAAQPVSTPPIDPIQSAARREMGRTFNLPQPGSATNGLPQIQPGEAEKIRAIAPALGVSDGDFEAGDKRLRALSAGAPMQPGDDRIVQSLTMMLNLIRQQSAPLPTPGAPIAQ